MEKSQRLLQPVSTKIKRRKEWFWLKKISSICPRRDLEFLKPVLEMRETQARWEDSTQDLPPEDESEEAAAEEEEQFHDTVDKELFVDESRSSTNSMNEEDAEPGPSSVLGLSKIYKGKCQGWETHG
ncbi:uncharacterized protein LOC143935924 [Lithobates pipiens]